MKLIERVVVDECVGQASALLEQLRCRLGDRPIKFVFLATEHPGIPDIEILDKLLDGRSALLTQDRGLHNLAIRRGFRSFVHTPESGLTDRRLAHVSAPDKCLRGARLDEKPQLLFVLRGVDENELLAIAGMLL
jgi:lipopolysaccharide/colanic/teichoic acid biosynthesis glycosyltransferase